MLPRQYVNPPLSIYKKIAISFLILTFVLIVVIFYFTISYAYIVITPKKEDIKADLNLVIVENAGLVSPADGIFSGKIIDQTLEGEKLFITTGTKQLMGDIVGKVILYNNLTQNQTLVATTRLLSPDGILFRLKNKVDIPAKGSLEAEVYADNPLKPLAKAGTKFTIPGLSASLQQIIYAENPQDFVASGQTVTAVSQEEMDKAAADFAEELALKIFTPEDANKIKILSKEIVEKNFDKKAGDEALNFRLNMKLKISGAIFDDAGIKEFAEKALTNQVPADKKLMATSSDKLVYELNKVDLANKLVQLKTSVSGIVILNENSPILERDKLVRKTPDEIRAYLQNFEQVENVDITFNPPWVKKMPHFQDHIIIKIVQ